MDDTQDKANAMVNQPIENGGRGTSATAEWAPLTPTLKSPQQALGAAPAPTNIESMTKLAAEIKQFIEEARIRAGRIYSGITGYTHDMDTELENTISNNLNGLLLDIRSEVSKIHSIIHSL